MKVAVRGEPSVTGRILWKLLESRGHALVREGADVVVYLPPARGRAFLAELTDIIHRGDCRRVVLRSHACAYGANAKNPGLMSEEFPSRAGPESITQRWLDAEQVVQPHPNAAILRCCAILDPASHDPLAEKLQQGWGTVLAGRDPNLQFLSPRDAAAALLQAVESEVTGLVNIAGRGVIPLKKAFRCATAARVPIPEFLVGGHSELASLRFNWTVSSERARRELGFEAAQCSVGALREYVARELRREPGPIADSFDPWGLDADYIKAWNWWFTLLRRVYWRIDAEGFEHIPQSGRALFIASHRGFMPLDAVMHLYRVMLETGRLIRFLIIPSLLSMPFLSNFLTKLGGVIANQENAARLLSEENLVGIFPEGIRGAFTPYREAYQLRHFAKSAFARIAIQNQAPIVPVAVVGHAEIFPIVGRINWGYVTRAHGWPYLPIAPMFPLAPVPIPSKWHVRILAPVSVDEFRPEDADNKRLVADFARYIQAIIQQNIDDMIPKRKNWFWGRVLDGAAPARQPFQAITKELPAVDQGRRRS